MTLYVVFKVLRRMLALSLRYVLFEAGPSVDGCLCETGGAAHTRAGRQAGRQAGLPGCRASDAPLQGTTRVDLVQFGTVVESSGDGERGRLTPKRLLITLEFGLLAPPCLVYICTDFLHRGSRL